MIRLGVNIDHVATIRNARGEIYPEPIRAALFAIKSGANSITIHLREDRRHINDQDLFKITKKKNIKVNLEMAPTKEMFRIALNTKPNFICLVPEKREEITTEGGLNLNRNTLFLKKNIFLLKKRGIKTSIFIEPRVQDVKKSKELGSDSVEIHTGKFCNLFNNKKNFIAELKRIKKSCIYANKIGLEVHAGHGLNYQSTKIISKIKNIKEFNIGHFIIGEAIFFGLPKVISNFKNILKT